jgi:hypothetical protein
MKGELTAKSKKKKSKINSKLRKKNSLMKKENDLISINLEGTREDYPKNQKDLLEEKVLESLDNYTMNSTVILAMILYLTVSL